MIPFANIALWFATSKTGQAIAAGFAVAGAVGIAVLKVFNAGKSAERAREDRQSLENLRSRAKTNDEVSTLGSTDLDKRLSKWVRRDDEG